MDIDTTPLGDLTPAKFFDEYWQKKPLLIRNAIPDFASPLSPEELAGLACDDEAESRLIIEEGGDYPWQLRLGPFTEADFADLPETRWTLLVQEVDRHVPEVARLLDRFRFIPSWRIDDVMVSYAPPQGGVGAHVDNYDVFLLQGLGHRRWQISHTPVYEEDLLPDLDVRILADFEPDEEWVLGPGDLLYLPPRIPHYGVAEDHCMTYSIGFRAPAYDEIVTGFMSYLTETLDPLDRYSDPDLKLQPHPGEIGPDALHKVRAVIRDLVQDEEIDRWFGRYITEPRRGYYPEPSDEDVTPRTLRAVLQEGGRLVRTPSARFAYVSHQNGETSLFVSGEEYVLDQAFAFAAPLLTGAADLDADALSQAFHDADFMMLIADLVNEGYLTILQDR